MSQQQCLPLPRRRKREHNESSSEIVFSDDMDAMTYLASVNMEAMRLPDVFVAPTITQPAKKEIVHENQNRESSSSFVPIDGSAAGINYILSNRVHIHPPPTKQHLPCQGTNTTDKGGTAMTMDEWISSTISNFSSLRIYLNQCHASGLGGKRFTGNRMDVPMSKDRVGWHIFCLGWDEAQGNIGGYFQDEDDDEEGDKSDRMISDTEKEGSADEETKGPFKSNMKNEKWGGHSTVPPSGHKPTTTLLCQFDQIIIRRVLAHHVYYLSEGWSFTEPRGRWIYALLARMEKPLHSEDASTLRGLLRDLCRLRAAIDLDDQTVMEKKGIEQRKILSIINVLIVVVGIYFEQGGGTDNLMAVTNP